MKRRMFGFKTLNVSDSKTLKKLKQYLGKSIVIHFDFITIWLYNKIAYLRVPSLAHFRHRIYGS